MRTLTNPVESAIQFPRIPSINDPSDERDRIIEALAYFVDPEDTILDDMPAFGLVDDRYRSYSGRIAAPAQRLPRVLCLSSD
ncbi:MAG: DUF1232 domain-containing protein [Burkholderiales bacterium]|nr:DUF1232 domain-containing protein [Burkholderiales bacterium]